MNWVYKVLHIDAKGFVGSKVVDEPGLEQKLNQLGEKGWELIAVTESNFNGTTFYFKRPK